MLLLRHAMETFAATRGSVGSASTAARTIYLPPTGQAWFGTTDAGSDAATPMGGASPGSINLNVMETSVLNATRTADIVHVYRNWSDVTGTFPGNTSAGRSIDTHIDGGRMVYIDWSPDTALHTPITGGWPAITAGTYDAAIIAFADKVKAWGQARLGTSGLRKIFLGFGHESDLEIQLNSAGYGSVSANTYANTQIVAAEYRAAYRHIYDIFQARGAGDYVIWIWTTEGHLDDVHLWDAMYPGDDIIDWIGYDPYGKVDHASTTTSRTWLSSLGRGVSGDPQGTYRFYQWATGLGATTNGLAIANGTRTIAKAGDLGKPIMAPEFGSAYSPALDLANVGTWRTFWDSGVTMMSANAYPQIRAMVYFGSYSSGQMDPRNDLGTGSIATPDAGTILERFRALAALSRFNAIRPY